MNEKSFKVIGKINEPPWRRIRFKTQDGYQNEGYVYMSEGDKFGVSQNSSLETMGLAQNWTITKNEILEWL